MFCINNVFQRSDVSSYYCKHYSLGGDNKYRFIFYLFYLKAVILLRIKMYTHAYVLYRTCHANYYICTVGTLLDVCVVRIIT